MHTELQGDLLIRSRALSDRDGELDGLESMKYAGSFQSPQSDLANRSSRARFAASCKYH